MPFIKKGFILKAIVFTDSHIHEKHLDELEGVFKEILKYSKEAPILICVGDYYDKKNPNTKEIEFGTKWAVKFKQSFPNFYMVTGNHPDIDGKLSSVSYLSHLGIQVVPELIFDNTYYGHYMLQESLGGFNEKESINTICFKSTTKLIILGHQHTYQEIKGQQIEAVHPGSIRYVDYGEVADKGKYIMLVDDGTYLQIRLNSPRKMYQVNSIYDAVNLPKDTYVRVVIKDMAQLLAEVNKINELRPTFFDLAVKLDFSPTISMNNQTVQVTDKKELLTNWLANIQDLEVKDLIIGELTKANIC